MQKFTIHRGTVAVLMRDNIDTDAIIPSREMKTVSKTGLGAGLFAGWRYTDEKARTPNPDFVLNQSHTEGASILISGTNFGCGSSREHAVWALADFGIRCVIANSFGSIFARNCVANGILPISLASTALTNLVDALEHQDAQEILEIDLINKQIRLTSGLNLEFELNETDHHLLLNGLDQIGLTRELDHLIGEFAEKDRIKRPWLA